MRRSCWTHSNSKPRHARLFGRPKRTKIASVCVCRLELLYGSLDALRMCPTLFLPRVGVILPSLRLDSDLLFLLHIWMRGRRAAALVSLGRVGGGALGRRGGSSAGRSFSSALAALVLLFGRGLSRPVRLRCLCSEVCYSCDSLSIFDRSVLSFGGGWVDCIFGGVVCVLGRIALPVCVFDVANV